MLSVIMLNVVLTNVIKLGVIILSVVAPSPEPEQRLEPDDISCKSLPTRARCIQVLIFSKLFCLRPRNKLESLPLETFSAASNVQSLPRVGSIGLEKVKQFYYN